MNDRLTADDGTHSMVWELLPWRVTGTLEAAERRLVDAHVATCDACRRELAAQERLCVSVAKAGDFDISDSRRWDVLHRRIQAEGGAVAAPHRAGFLEVLYDRLREYWRWPALAAAICFLLIAVGGLPGAERDGDFRTLTSPSAESAAGQGPVLRIKAASGMDPAALRSLLEPLGLEILEGPSPTGVYTARPLGDASLEAAQAALKGRTGIEFVTIRPEG